MLCMTSDLTALVDNRSNEINSALPQAISILTPFTDEEAKGTGTE